MARRSIRAWLSQQLELSHGTSTPLRSMEGLRGVAVFLVFLVHYSSLMAPFMQGRSVAAGRFVHAFGNIGVYLFFVLSGFLIYGSLLRRPTFAAARYARRRVQRIYPTFLVVFAIYIALSLALPAHNKLPSATDQALLYVVQNLLLLPGVFDITPIITVAWSLSYEVFYYLAIPLVTFGLRLRDWAPGQRCVLWCGVAIVGFASMDAYAGLVNLMMFVSGIVLYELHAHPRIALRRGGTRCLLLALALFGLREFWPLNYRVSVIAVFVLFALLCLNAFEHKTPAYRWLTFTPLRWLGNMSYSYYLIHGLALQAGFIALAAVSPDDYASPTAFYWMWLPMFAITLVVSLGLFVLIERPLSLHKSPAAAPEGSGR